MLNKFLIFLILIFFSCNNNKVLFENNLKCYKNYIQEINHFFLDTNASSIDFSSYIEDDFIFHSYPAGYKKGIEHTKEKYIQSFNLMKEIKMSVNIGHSIYLPGIDEKNHKYDGSVRVYYGANLILDTNNVEYSGYRTVNFHNGRISEIWEWADYGGVKNQLFLE
tara:strand:- start:2599 stop:3093 length:495 start_codon:yes stop_codon:yes gene_type:complete